jgi:hypothetical protein
VSRDSFVETCQIAKLNMSRLAETLTHGPDCGQFFDVLLEDVWHDGE